MVEWVGGALDWNCFPWQDMILRCDGIGWHGMALRWRIVGFYWLANLALPGGKWEWEGREGRELMY
jgi:hypothetical protein